jgi:hypothetical protein
MGLFVKMVVLDSLLMALDNPVHLIQVLSNLAAGGITLPD